MLTPSAISVPRPVMTVGWTPTLMSGPGSSAAVSPAMARRARGTRMAPERPKDCQSAPSQRIAARACPERSASA